MNTLVEFTEANRQLAEAKTVDDVKKIIATADMMMRAAKEMKEERARTEADARELRLRGERRLGEMIALQPKQTGGDAAKLKARVIEKPEVAISYAEVGIDKNLANRARKAAALDEHEFEEKILDVRQGGPKKKRNPNTPRDPDFTDGKQLAVAQAVLDSGMSYAETAEAFDLTSVQQVKIAVAKEQGRRDPAIDPETLPKNAQEKLQRAIKQAVRKLEADLEHRVQAEVKRSIDETVLPHYNKKLDEYDEVIKARRGIMDRPTYRLILSCLHPDQSASPDRIRRAFDAFRKIELVLCDEAEMPTASADIPHTYEELMKRREEVRAARKHQRQQPNGIQRQ